MGEVVGFPEPRKIPREVPAAAQNDGIKPQVRAKFERMLALMLQIEEIARELSQTDFGAVWDLARTHYSLLGEEDFAADCLFALLEDIDEEGHEHT